MTIDGKAVKQVLWQIFGFNVAGEVNIPLSNTNTSAAQLATGGPSTLGLLQLLQRLDKLLERAIAVARTVHAQGAAPDPYRGLYVGDEEVTRLLARNIGTPLFKDNLDGGRGLADGFLDAESQIGWLQKAFGLSAFDVEIIIVALAPEIDLRYERLYAYLQDDVTRKRPSVDLVLNLLCPSVEAKLVRRSHLAADAPLIFHRLLHLTPDLNQVQPPLLSHYLTLDDQIVRLLLGQVSLDLRLAPFCQMIEPAISFDELSANNEFKTALLKLVAQIRETRRPLRLYFQGPCSVDKRRAAEALAAGIGMRFLIVDLARVLVADRDFEQLVKLLLREAWFQDAVLYLDGLDALRSDKYSVQAQILFKAFANDMGLTVLAGTQPWAPCPGVPIGVVTAPFPIPDFAGRRACWQFNLAAKGITLDDHTLEVLADRFRLTPDQISDAVATAHNYACWHTDMPAADELPRPSGASRTVSQLFAAARAQSAHHLAELAHKIDPVYTWRDIVLPDNTLAQLHEICQRVTHRHRVLAEWGFDRKLSIGKGVNALFAGPSGTGKTMAAEIIANELELDLYKIDLSGVVSKYIGETEKNLDRIFTAAENANAILFFDEADALFGKRSEVRDSHDRYANIEISYLLQKMEECEGVTILATNLRQNLDESFVRRLAFTIHFPFPDEADRRRIWTGIWPAETPIAADLDVDLLAHQFKLSGGNIKNIALAAAFFAAEDGGSVTMIHALQATRREYQKLGKPLSTAELGAFGQEASG